MVALRAKRGRDRGAQWRAAFFPKRTARCLANCGGIGLEPSMPSPRVAGRALANANADLLLLSFAIFRACAMTPRGHLRHIHTRLFSGLNVPRIHRGEGTALR